MVVNRARIPPPATLGLLALLAVVFVLECALTGVQQAIASSISIETLDRLGGNYYAATIEGGQLWRLAAAMLLHGSLIHIAFNAYAMWNLGSNLERYAGPRATLIAFVVTGLIASLASSLLGNRQAISVGASGAVFGVLGFACVVGVRDLAQFWLQLRRNAMVLLPALLLSAVIPNVDNFGHVGGVVAGLGLGSFYGRPPRSLENAVALGALGVLVWALISMVANAFG